jgi:DNA-binding transcriptional regulator GbsR (MarR family)
MTITRKRCAFCQHEQREELEAALEQGMVSCDDLDSRNNWRSGTAAQHQRNHMGEYTNSSNPKCKLCVDPMRKHYEEALSNGNITSDAISQVLGISKQQVQRHMKHHLAPLVQQSAATMIAKKEVNEIDLLSANVQRLDDKLNDLFLNTDLEPREIDSLTKLAKEVRESLKYLLEFKGKLIHKRQDTIIVAQMQVVQEVLAQNNPEIWLDIKKKMQERLQ